MSIRWGAAGTACAEVLPVGFLLSYLDCAIEQRMTTDQPKIRLPVQQRIHPFISRRSSGVMVMLRRQKDKLRITLV